MPRRVGYIRVSTTKNEQLSALEDQRSVIQKAGADEIIQDIQSGRDTDRDGYQRLLGMIAVKAVDEILIARVDRLGRDAADTDAAIALAAHRGVTITALEGGKIESETTGGFIMSRMLTTFAEAESRMLSSRIRAGLTEKRLKHRPCRGRAPWGYRKSPDGSTLEPDPVEWPRAQAFLELLVLCKWRMNTALDQWAAQGRGDIPLHSCRAVKAWLTNPILRGGLGYHQQSNHVFAQIVWNTHPALLSPDAYIAFTEALSQNRRMWGKQANKTPRLLTGLCRCGHCGKAMSYAGGRTIPSILCRERGCVQRYKSTHESLIAGAITHTISAHIHEVLRSAPRAETPEIASLQADIASLESRNDPDLASAIEAKRQRLAALRSAPTVDLDTLRALSQPRAFEHATYEELRAIFVQCVSMVVVTKQAVDQVVLRF